MKFGSADLGHLENAGFIAIERNVPTIKITYGKRTLALLESFRKHWKAAK